MYNIVLEDCLVSLIPLTMFCTIFHHISVHLFSGPPLSSSVTPAVPLWVSAFFSLSVPTDNLFKAYFKPDQGFWPQQFALHVCAHRGQLLSSLNRWAGPFLGPFCLGFLQDLHVTFSLVISHISLFPQLSSSSFIHLNTISFKRILDFFSFQWGMINGIVY